MRRNIRIFVGVLALAIVLMSVSGLTFSYLQEQQETEAGEYTSIELVETVPDGSHSLRFGEPSEQSLSVKNVGTRPCYLRVKISIPQAGGKALLQVGTVQDNRFTELGFYTAQDAVSESQREYWVREGAYLYYKNRDTGDLLDAGKETPVLYQAVQIAPEIRERDLSGCLDCQLYSSAQAIEAGNYVNSGQAWKFLEK